LADFNKYDTNKNGQLTIDEIAGLVEHELGRPPSAEETEVYFVKLDTNHDACVQLPEYIASIMGAEWELVGDSLPPPPALYIPPELEEEEPPEVVTPSGEMTRTWSQGEINKRRNVSCKDVVAVMEQIRELNKEELEEAEKKCGRKLDEPSFDSSGAPEHWHLHGLGLTKLPDAFSGLRFSGDLNLAGNKLKVIPNLPQVKGSLILEMNPLESLPDNIGELHLADLSLLACRLRKLPDTFGNLKVDGDLTLFGNPLKQLPASMKALDVKGTVLLDDGQMERFKECFGDAVKLDVYTK